MPNNYGVLEISIFIHKVTYRDGPYLITGELLSSLHYNMPVYLDFLQVAKTKLQLAVCGSNLPTLLELVKSHNTS